MCTLCLRRRWGQRPRWCTQRCRCGCRPEKKEILEKYQFPIKYLLLYLVRPRRRPEFRAAPPLRTAAAAATAAEAEEETADGAPAEKAGS